MAEEPQQLTDSALYASLVQSGVPEEVAEYASFLEVEGYIISDDVNQKVVEELQTATQNVMAQVTHECQTADLTKMKNKSAYLIGIIKTNKKKLNAPITESESDLPYASFAASLPLKKIMYAPFPDDVKPSEEAVRALIARSGYDITVTSGQRKYGPPPNWKGEEPAAGCEVFIGGLKHRGNFEDVLVPWLEPCGQIYELRMMTCQYGGTGKGFAFCIFADKESATRCVSMRNMVVLPGNQKPLEVKLHNPNTRLYVARIDKVRNRDQILTELVQHGDGITDLILKMAEDGHSHRGFGFVDYRSHKQASAAKRNLENGGLLFGKAVAVSWAEPINEVSEEEMSKVKTLYITGLKAGVVTSESLNDRFSPYGDISSLKLIKDYAFIEYKDRPAAVEAMNDLHNTQVEGCTISAVLATPHRKVAPNLRGGGVRGVPRGGGFGGMTRGRGGPPGRGGRGGFVGATDGYGAPVARGGFGERGRGGFPPRGRGGFADRGRGGFAERGRGGFAVRGRGGFADRGRGGYPLARGGAPIGMVRGARGMSRGSPRGAPRGAIRGVRGAPHGGPQGMVRGVQRGAPRGIPRGAMRGGPARGGYAGNGAMAPQYNNYAPSPGYGPAAETYGEEESYEETADQGEYGGYTGAYAGAYTEETQYDPYNQQPAPTDIYGMRKRPQEAAGDGQGWGVAKRARAGATGVTRPRYAAAPASNNSYSTPQTAANGKAWYEDDVW